eukprot:scaffold281853_cov17-Prasinocladus_malaysianus.AAC.1
MTAFDSASEDICSGAALKSELQPQVGKLDGCAVNLVGTARAEGSAGADPHMVASYLGRSGGRAVPY